VSSYEYIQFIGHSINTGPEVTSSDTGQEVIYKGINDPFADLGKRTHFFRNIVENSRNIRQISQDKNVLKLLMLPEFFFRGQKKAYEMELIDKFIITQETKKEKTNWNNWIKDTCWSDWVFVFGTVIGREESKDDDETDGYQYQYQYCLIQQGGNNQHRIVMKEHLAENEFVVQNLKRDNQQELIRCHHRLPPEYSGSGMEEQQNHHDGRSIFQLAGITFGLEIGTDHHNGRLKRSPQKPGHNKVQIQLIPSCGTEIRPESVVTTKGGWVFNCDGLNDCHTDLRKVIKEHNPSSRQSAHIALYPQLPPASIQTVPCAEELFVNGAGKLRFYEPVKIPEPAIVGQSDSVE
jgi:hypothetical protein